MDEWLGRGIEWIKWVGRVVEWMSGLVGWLNG